MRPDPEAARRTRDPRHARHLHRAPTLALLAALLALVLVAAGCDMPSTGGLGQVYGSGEPVTKSYGFTGFTRVVVEDGFVATVEYGESFAVSVTVDDNLVEDHLRSSWTATRCASAWRTCGSTAT